MCALDPLVNPDETGKVRQEVYSNPLWRKVISSTEPILNHKCRDWSGLGEESDEDQDDEEDENSSLGDIKFEPCGPTLKVIDCATPAKVGWEDECTYVLTTSTTPCQCD